MNEQQLAELNQKINQDASITLHKCGIIAIDVLLLFENEKENKVEE